MVEESGEKRREVEERVEIFDEVCESVLWKGIDRALMPKTIPIRGIS